MKLSEPLSPNPIRSAWQVASGATTQVDNLWIKLVDSMRYHVGCRLNLNSLHPRLGLRGSWSGVNPEGMLCLRALRLSETLHREAPSRISKLQCRMQWCRGGFWRSNRYFNIPESLHASPNSPYSWGMQRFQGHSKRL